MALMTYGTSYGNTWGQCGAVGAGGLGRHFAWRGWPVIVDLGSPAAATQQHQCLGSAVWEEDTMLVEWKPHVSWIICV